METRSCLTRRPSTGCPASCTKLTRRLAHLQALDTPRVSTIWTRWTTSPSALKTKPCPQVKIASKLMKSSAITSRNLPSTAKMNKLELFSPQVLVAANSKTSSNISSRKASTACQTTRQNSSKTERYRRTTLCSNPSSSKSTYRITTEAVLWETRLDTICSKCAEINRDRPMVKRILSNSMRLLKSRTSQSWWSVSIWRARRQK